MNERHRIQDGLIYVALSISFIALLLAYPRGASRAPFSTIRQPERMAARVKSIHPCIAIQLDIHPPSHLDYTPSPSDRPIGQTDIGMSMRFVIDPEDTREGGRTAADEAGKAALQLLVDGIIARAFEEKPSKHPKASSQQAHVPESSSRSATLVTPDSGKEPPEGTQKQEIKRWQELLKLEEDVKLMAERLKEREHAIEERERQLIVRESAGEAKI